jgi:hypothetical protein
MTYEDAANAIREIARQIRTLEQELQEVGERRADAEATYRVALAGTMRKHRENGATVAEAEAFARADAAVLARARDRAELQIREILEKLEDRRGERHGLHRLIDWSASRPPLPEEGQR